MNLFLDELPNCVIINLFFGNPGVHCSPPAGEFLRMGKVFVTLQTASGTLSRTDVNSDSCCIPPDVVTDGVDGVNASVISLYIVGILCGFLFGSCGRIGFEKPFDNDSDADSITDMDIDTDTNTGADSGVDIIVDTIDTADTNSVTDTDTGTDSESDTLSPCVNTDSVYLFDLCWYLSTPDESCIGVCSRKGGYDPMTEQIVGTPRQGGALENCAAIFAALGYSQVVNQGYNRSGGLGCHRFDGVDLWWLTSPDFDPTNRGVRVEFICGCTPP